MILECIKCGSDRVENKDLKLCASCNAARRKAERQANKVKVVQPANKVSPKRAGQIAEYVKLKREYIALYPVCEVPECDLKAVEIHHQRGKEGERLTDVNYFMSVCRKHHEEMTEHSKDAIDKGYSHLRTKTE
jgi:hypothetical protein